MATCSVIFWSIIVPIAMYGCELLMLSDKSIAILESFQEHIGKGIQHSGSLPLRSALSIPSDGLGSNV